MKTQLAPLHRGGVVLRLIERSDLHTTLTWRNRDEVRRWFKMSDLIDEDHHNRWFESYLENANDYVFVVWVDDHPVGQVAIYGIDAATGSAEIGRFIAAPGWGGKGYMYAAISALVDLARKQFALSRVYLQVFAHNERAIGLYTKLGFALDSRSGDMLVYSKSTLDETN